MSEQSAHRDEKVLQFWKDYKKALDREGVTQRTTPFYMRNVDRYIRTTDGTRLKQQDSRDVEFYLIQLFKENKLDEWQ